MALKPIPRSVCVFCASSDRVDQAYKDVTQGLGRSLASHNLHLVYGGAQGGLMGALADAALAEGGQVTGVMPEFLTSRERAHKGLTTLHITKDMHQRQQMMAALSERFVVLPGGPGTWTEFFEILTWRQLGLHDCPIGLMNFKGYWDPLLEMFASANAQGFLHKDPEALFSVFETVEDLNNFLAVA